MNAAGAAEGGASRMRRTAFYIIFAAACAAPFLVKRVPQDVNYHHFADRREFLGIVNFGDVMSNLPFLPVGIAGLLFILRRPQDGDGAFGSAWERALFGMFFFGVALTTFGSSFYHLAPDHFRVMWDRIPIAIACSSLLLILLAERVSAHFSQILAAPWVIFSLGSVVYWFITESAGMGDLRFWGLAQFAPALLIPAGIALFPRRRRCERFYFYALICYVIAKLLEWQDANIFSFGGWVSGHSLKHLAAAAAAAFILQMLIKRAAPNDPAARP